MITIFVSGVLINGEEIIKRDSREIVCSRRVTIKIENWVDPEARWKVTSDKRYRARIPVISYPCFGSNGYLSLSLRALIRKCSSLQVMCKKKCILLLYIIVIYICGCRMHESWIDHAIRENSFSRRCESQLRLLFGNRDPVVENWFMWIVALIDLISVSVRMTVNFYVV